MGDRIEAVLKDQIKNLIKRAAAYGFERVELNITSKLYGTGHYYSCNVRGENCGSAQISGEIPAAVSPKAAV
jgi:hypothetical protein